MTQMHKYPTSFQAVDVIIFNPTYTQVLLGKKPNQKKWRFIGGFVDPNDASLELAASRELREEVIGIISHTNPLYKGSFRVDDLRYQDSVDKIMSAVFEIKLSSFEDIKGGDDIESIKWFDLIDTMQNYKKNIVPEHFPIIENFF